MTDTAPQAGVEQVSQRVAEHVGAPETVNRENPGQRASAGTLSMYRRPSQLSIPPQLATSGGSPRPRKLREASAMITSPMVTVKMTIMGAMMLGSTCRKRIWRVGTPTAFAARKYTFSLMPMTALRAILEPLMPPAMPRTRMICSWPWPRRDFTNKKYL